MASNSALTEAIVYEEDWNPRILRRDSWSPSSKRNRFPIPGQLYEYFELPDNLSERVGQKFSGYHTSRGRYYWDQKFDCYAQ